MKAFPIPKKLYEAARFLKVTNIELQFSGGSDEGLLDVNFQLEDKYHERGSPEYQLLETLEEQIEIWVWDNFEYSVDGDGAEYGDDIDYDLVNNTVEVSAWYMSPCDGESEFEPCENAFETEEPECTES